MNLRRIILFISTCIISVSSYGEDFKSELREVLQMWGKSYRNGASDVGCPKGSKQIQKKVNSDGSSFGLECRLSTGIVVAIESSIYVAKRMIFESEKFSDCKSESSVRKFLENFSGDYRFHYDPKRKKYDFILQDKISGENAKTMYWFISGYCIDKSLYAIATRKDINQLSSLSPDSGWKK